MPLDGGLSGGFTLVLFPNLIILRSQIRVVRPIAVDRTEVYTSVVRLQGVDEAINVKRMRDQETEFGAAGIVLCRRYGDLRAQPARAAKRRGGLAGVCARVGARAGA